MKTTEERLQEIKHKSELDQTITVEEMRFLLEQHKYLTTVLNHITKDLAKAEEDIEYNASLCKEKDEEIAKLKKEGINR